MVAIETVNTFGSSPCVDVMYTASRLMRRAYDILTATASTPSMCGYKQAVNAEGILRLIVGVG